MADGPSGTGSGRSHRGVMIAIVGFQILGAVFFSYDILGPLLGLRTQPLDWRVHELIEISAAAGLVIGSLFGLVMIRRSDARRQEAEDKLAALTNAFHELLEARFAEWGLTPAEHDVAFFVMKGLSTLEIAGLRQTSEGTVKAQTNAIYRKAGVSGRAQLVSLFIEDLLDSITAGFNVHGGLEYLLTDQFRLYGVARYEVMQDLRYPEFRVGVQMMLVPPASGEEKTR